MKSCLLEHVARLSLRIVLASTVLLGLAACSSSPSSLPSGAASDTDVHDGIAVHNDNKAPAESPAMAGEVKRITVNANSLADNLIGEPTERDVLVYLPPSYHTSDRDYPVVYVLHGWGGNAAAWFSDNGGDPDAQNGLEALLATGDAKEMILVVPDVSTRHFSSWFRSSPVTGDWETYLTQELVEQIDSQFRTLASPESRGLMGHSSGGQGAFYLLLNHPEVYGAVYSMAPGNVEHWGTPEKAKGYYHKAIKPKLADYTGNHDDVDGGVHYFISTAHFYVFDENNPPTYIKPELTLDDFKAMHNFTVNGEIDQHVQDFAKGRYQHLAVKTDVGTREERTEQFTRLVNRLAKLGLPVELHTFDAGHVDKMDESTLEVLKFMSESLVFTD